MPTLALESQVAVEITPGNNAGLTFKKGESELNFISFKNARWWSFI